MKCRVKACAFPAEKDGELCTVHARDEKLDKSMTGSSMEQIDNPVLRRIDYGIAQVKKWQA